jgi:hypothetical protein
MISGIPSVSITQNERFLICDAVLLGVLCVCYGMCVSVCVLRYVCYVSYVISTLDI